MPTHKYKTCTHTYALKHALAAQLGLNRVSLLTYFFIVTERQMQSPLEFHINPLRERAIKAAARLHNTGVQEQEGAP